MSPSEAEIQAVTLADDGTFPNNPELPLLVYRGAFLGAEPAAIEATFDANQWPPAWRYGVFDFHHYHSTAHEVLGCFAGRAEIQFGGPQGPVLEAGAGDVVVLPAGTAHKSVAARGGFRCVGAYPAGQDFDMNRGAPDERPAGDRHIAAVPLPAADPVYGPDGPLLRYWSP
jgi:uncharacterized protein YjlB